MSAMPEQSQFGGIGVRPVAPTGVKRLWPLFRATLGTVALGALIVAWEGVAPAPLRPSTLAGNLIARVASNEINGTADAHVALQGRMNDLNYELQIRLLKEQTFIQKQLENYQGVQQAVQVADMACIFSMLVGGVASAYHNVDVADGAKNVAQGTCGVAQAGHVMLTATQQQIMQGDITMASAGFDGHHYNAEQVAILDQYYQTLPKSVQRQIIDGAGSTDIAADRALLYFRTSDPAAKPLPGF